MSHLLKIKPTAVYTRAEQGHVWFQFWLGKAYERGDLGVPLDYTESMRWYLMAANQGFADAQKEMGDFYYFGNGVAKSYRDAFVWYRRAAEQGQNNAQGTLGIMYEFGQGVPQDFVQAHAWYNIAAANGDKNFEEGRAVFGMARDTLAVQMTPSQIAEAQRMAREWNPKTMRNSFPQNWFDETLR